MEEAGARKPCAVGRPEPVCVCVCVCGGGERPEPAEPRLGPVPTALFPPGLSWTVAGRIPSRQSLAQIPRLPPFVLWKYHDAWQRGP